MMTIASRLALGAGLCAALAISACGDAGDDSATQGPGTAGQTTSEPGKTTGPAVTTGGTSGGKPTTGDGGSEGNSASVGTTGNPTTGNVGPTTGPEATTTPPATSTGPDAMTTGPDETTGEPPNGLVRFVVLGDTGEGNEGQYAVAQAIVEVCAQRGCDFGVLTGDNFYDSGVSGTDDPQWQEKFELPYEDITFPMYAVLGNHDYGGDGLGVDFDGDKPDYQVEYTDISEKWTMPAKFYDFKLGHAHFWGLDTNQVMTDPFNGDPDDQQDWLLATVAASQQTWKIGFGHHPYISNGDHGNAGDYENIEGFDLPFVSGASVKEFMEEAVCGKLDVYICGHDHSIQWLEPTCGTEFIISGSGSKAEGLPGDNPFFFQKSDTEGFVWVELEGDSFTGVFFDQNGAELYTKTITK